MAGRLQGLKRLAMLRFRQRWHGACCADRVIARRSGADVKGASVARKRFAGGTTGAANAGGFPASEDARRGKAPKASASTPSAGPSPSGVPAPDPARASSAGQTPGSDGAFAYKTNVILNTLNISRSTLRHYEQIGIVSPERDPESGYRIFTNSDVFCAVECVMMKTVGVQPSQASEVIRRPGLTARDYMEECRAASQAQMEWASAAQERFGELSALVEADFDAKPRLVLSDRWLLFYDGAERGYDRFRSDETQDVLLAGMPVSSFAAVVRIDVVNPRQKDTKWGRAYPVRYQHLFADALARGAEPTHLGGCPCLVVPYCADWDKIPNFDPTGSVCARFAETLGREGLEQNGPIFAPDVLPSCGKVYSSIFLPVRATSLRGRMRLSSLRGVTSSAGLRAQKD